MKRLKNLVIFNEKIHALLTLVCLFFIANVFIMFSSKHISQEMTTSISRHLFNIPNLMSAALLLAFNLCCILLAHFMALLNYQTALLSLNTLFNQFDQNKISHGQLFNSLKEKHPECTHLIEWTHHKASELSEIDYKINDLKNELLKRQEDGPLQ